MKIHNFLKINYENLTLDLEVVHTLNFSWKIIIIRKTL